ncbi:MAG: FAD-binding protein [Gammaproteobacteria bacterium]
MKNASLALHSTTHYVRHTFRDLSTRCAKLRVATWLKPSELSNFAQRARPKPDLRTPITIANRLSNATPHLPPQTSRQQQTMSLEGDRKETPPRQLIKEIALSKLISTLHSKTEELSSSSSPSTLNPHKIARTSASLSLQNLMSISDELVKEFGQSAHDSIEEAIQSAHVLLKNIDNHISASISSSYIPTLNSSIDVADLNKIYKSCKKTLDQGQDSDLIKKFAKNQTLLHIKRALIKHRETLSTQTLDAERLKLKSDVQAEINRLEKGIEKVVTSHQSSILIVGSGPAGLWAAIQASETGHSVTLLEKRNTFDRTSIVALNPDRIFQLQELATKLQEINPQVRINSKPINDIVTNLRNYKTIKTKDLQSLLAHYIETVANANPASSAPIRVIKGVDIQKINAKSQAAVVMHKKDGSYSIESFRDIIHADGTKSPSHEMLIKNMKENGISTEGLESEKKVRTNETKKRPQAALYMRDKSDKEIKLPGGKISNIHLNNNKNLKARLKESLESLGWTSLDLPKFYFFVSADKKRIRAAGEVPENIGNKEKEEEKKETGKKERSNREGIDKHLEELKRHRDNSNLSGEDKQALNTEIEKYERKRAKEKMNGAFFDLLAESFSIDQTAKPIGHNGISYIIGDAAVSPNYHYAHGTSDAFTDAEAAIDSIKLIHNDIESLSINKSDNLELNSNTQEIKLSDSHQTLRTKDFHDYMDFRISNTLDKFKEENFSSIQDLLQPDTEQNILNAQETHPIT